MDGVLYVGHGSRINAGNKQFLVFIHKVMEMLSLSIKEVAFIELTKPTIQEGIKNCIEQGATRIFVQPVLLLEAGHAKKDIPEEIEKAKRLYPEVQFIYGSPIGVDDRMIDIVYDRLQEKGFLKETNDKIKASVLLVGRGSSDIEAKADFEEIARRLKEKLHLNQVTPCYLAAAEPIFEDGLQQIIDEDNEIIYVMPYLLFTGVLMKRMGRAIIDLETTEHKQVHLCNFLGYHEQIRNLIYAKTIELMKGSHHELHAN